MPKILCGIFKVLSYKLQSCLSKTLCSGSHLDKSETARSDNSAQGHMASSWHNHCSNPFYQASLNICPMVFCLKKQKQKQKQKTATTTKKLFWNRLVIHLVITMTVVFLVLFILFICCYNHGFVRESI